MKRQNQDDKELVTAFNRALDDAWGTLAATARLYRARVDHLQPRAPGDPIHIGWKKAVNRLQFVDYLLDTLQEADTLEKRVQWYEEFNGKVVKLSLEQHTGCPDHPKHACAG